MEKPLHTDDLVARKEAKTMTEYGIIERTHEDVDTHLPYPDREDPGNARRDPGVSKQLFNRFLLDGVPPANTAFVRWHNNPRPTLTQTSQLELLDRSLLIGDVVKRSSSDAMSGVVINTSTKCSLQPIGDVRIIGVQGNNTIKGHLPSGDFGRQRNSVARQAPPAHLIDIPTSELKYSDAMNEEDLFIYKDRLGRIDELVHYVTLRLLDNSAVEIHEDQLEKVDGSAEAFTVGDIASATKPTLRRGKWIFGKYNPNTPPVGTVVATRVVSAEVTWLQRRIGAPESEDPPSVLESNEFESEHFRIYDRSRLPNHRSAESTRSYSEIDVGVGERVRFKDLAGACVKYDGSTQHGKLPKIVRQDTLGYDLNVFEVVKFRTDVFVQWQDLSISHEASINLVPDSDIEDEHAAWPGEIAHTLDFSPVAEQPGMTRPSRLGVVQTVKASERMATLRWSDNGYVQYFEDPDEGLGAKTMILGVVNLAQGATEELSLYDVEAPASMNVRRGDIALLMDEARSSPLGGATGHHSDIDWVGEIVDTCLDGTLTVRLGAAREVRDMKVTREHVHVAVRSDGTNEPDQWEQEAWDEDGEMDEEEGSSDSDEVAWSSADSEEERLRVTYEDENGDPLDEDEVEDDDWESDAFSDRDGDMEMTDAPPLSPPTSYSATPPEPHVSTNHDRPKEISGEVEDGPEAYLLLEGAAPASHHYISEPSTESSAHMKRLQKEHKILRSPGSLPPGVYVRTWESRMDLMRVLLVGPAETPYSDAPFVIDFYLPSKFPTDPPSAYFHSWTLETGLGGVGRVNPNLYEDGKICLSLLGTWDGSKSEGWNPARSTLLQVIVSILGLVLVREPYFNEAGYQPLAGLESSRRPSALYNERTYLRANSFIVKAVDWINSAEGTNNISIEGLQDVVRWLYKDANGKQLLKRKVQEVEDVLGRSEASTAEPDGLRTMSKGACIPLRRVLARLNGL